MKKFTFISIVWCIAGNNRKFACRFTVAILCSLSFECWGQNTVTYDVEPAILTITQKHTEAWQKVKTVSGYRIQIGALSGSQSRVKAYEIKDTFDKLFSDIECYLSYAEPNFRIRVGDFRSKLDALRYLGKIQQYFPGAFIVKENIVVTKL
jgi:hypothetical protein